MAVAQESHASLAVTRCGGEVPLASHSFYAGAPPANYALRATLAA